MVVTICADCGVELEKPMVIRPGFERAACRSCFTQLGAATYHWPTYQPGWAQPSAS